MRRTLLLLLMVLVPTVSLAQELSEAEKAARSQRGLTASEIAAREKDCRNFATGTGRKHDVSTTLTGEIVSVRAFDILLISQIVHDEVAGKFAIHKFDTLPNGGIGGKDLCGIVNVYPPVGPASPGVAVRKAGLLLREGLNLDEEYPNTSNAIWDRNQINLYSKNWYVVLRADDAKVAKWLEQKSAKWMFEQGSREMLVKDDRLYIPIKAPNL